MKIDVSGRKPVSYLIMNYLFKNMTLLLFNACSLVELNLVFVLNGKLSRGFQMTRLIGIFINRISLSLSLFGQVIWARIQSFLKFSGPLQICALLATKKLKDYTAGTRHKCYSSWSITITTRTFCTSTSKAKLTPVKLNLGMWRRRKRNLHPENQAETKRTITWSNKTC